MGNDISFQETLIYSGITIFQKMSFCPKVKKVCLMGNNVSFQETLIYSGIMISRKFVQFPENFILSQNCQFYISIFANYLQWYNDLNVNPIITAIEKMNDYCKDKNLDFVHQAITLTNIAKRICLNSITDPNVEIHLFNQKQQDTYKLFKDNIVGGPSIIYHRNQQAQKSFILAEMQKLEGKESYGTLITNKENTMILSMLTSQKLTDKS